MVLDYLVKNGHNTVFMHCRNSISFIQALKEFQFIDKDGTDQGVKGIVIVSKAIIVNTIVVATVRERAEELVALVADKDRVMQEKLEARVVRNLLL